MKKLLIALMIMMFTVSSTAFAGAWMPRSAEQKASDECMSVATSDCKKQAAFGTDDYDFDAYRACYNDQPRPYDVCRCTYNWHAERSSQTCEELGIEVGSGL